jgi:hypothetical protein
MRDFTYSLFQLVSDGQVSLEVAMSYAPNREALSSLIKGIDTGSEGLISRM